MHSNFILVDYWHFNIILTMISQNYFIQIFFESFLQLENMRILFDDEELFTQAMNLAKKENPPTPTSPVSIPDIEELSPHTHSPNLEVRKHDNKHQLILIINAVG